MTKQFSLLITFCTLLSTYVFSQQKTSGVIYYDQVIDIKAMMPQAGSAGAEANAQQRTMIMSAIGGNIPDKITNKFEIAFNPSGAKFQKSITEDITANPEAGAPAGAGAASGMMMRFGGGDRELFFSNTDKVTESFEMNGEAVLLESILGNGAKEAELSSETRKIIGFDCKKAIVTGRNGSKTTIWYTTELSFKASPLIPMWIEGVVLGVENERMKYFATAIEYSKIKDSEVAVPKKGKIITQEEYQKQMEAMRSRFRNRAGGQGGQTEIRIQQ